MILETTDVKKERFQAMKRGAEEDWLFNEGTSCLIHKDSRIKREVSLVA